MERNSTSVFFIVFLLTIAGVFAVFYLLWQMSTPSASDYEGSQITIEDNAGGSSKNENADVNGGYDLEKEDFQKLAFGSSAECREFLTKYPKSRFKTQVEQLLNKLLKQEVFTDARIGGSLECEEYLKKFPNTDHAVAVKKKFLTLPLNVMHIECSNIFSVDVSPDGKLMAVGTMYDSGEKHNDNLAVYKGELQVFDITDIRNAKLKYSYKQKDLDRIERVRFSPDGKLLAIGTARISKYNSYDNTIEVVLLDVKNSSKIREVARINGKKKGSINSIDFSPDSKHLVYGSSSYFYIVDIRDLRKPVEIDKSKAHDWELQDVKYSPDGKFIASCAAKDTGIYNNERMLVYEGEFKLWGVIDSGEVYEANSTLCHDRTCLTLAFSSNGRYLATGSLNEEVKIGDVSDTEDVFETALLGKLEESVFNVLFCNSDKNLIFSTRNEIYFCNNKGFKEIEQIRQLDCEGFICDMGLSHDDTVITACTNKCKVYFWPTEKYLEKLLKMK